MATLPVRDLDDDLVARLKQRARTHGRSAEAEHRAILESALAPSRAEFIALVKHLHEQTRGTKQIDSAEIIRAYRDRDLPEGWE
jgi:plasmid stability protein